MTLNQRRHKQFSCQSATFNVWTSDTVTSYCVTAASAESRPSINLQGQAIDLNGVAINARPSSERGVSILECKAFDIKRRLIGTNRPNRSREAPDIPRRRRLRWVVIGSWQLSRRCHFCRKQHRPHGGRRRRQPWRHRDDRLSDARFDQWTCRWI
jgi:hypothetical protein